MLKLIENTRKSQRESYLYNLTTVVLIRQISGLYDSTIFIRNGRHV